MEELNKTISKDTSAVTSAVPFQIGHFSDRTLFFLLDTKKVYSANVALRALQGCLFRCKQENCL